MFYGGGKNLGNDIPGGEPRAVEAQQGEVKEQYCVVPVACGELWRAAGDGIEYRAMDLRFYPVSAQTLKWRPHTYSQIFIFYSLQWWQWKRVEWRG